MQLCSIQVYGHYLNVCMDRSVVPSCQMGSHKFSVHIVIYSWETCLGGRGRLFAKGSTNVDEMLLCVAYRASNVSTKDSSKWLGTQNQPANNFTPFLKGLHTCIKWTRIRSSNACILYNYTAPHRTSFETKNWYNLGLFGLQLAFLPPF